MSSHPFVLRPKSALSELRKRSPDIVDLIASTALPFKGNTQIVSKNKFFLGMRWGKSAVCGSETRCSRKIRCGS